MHLAVKRKLCTDERISMADKMLTVQTVRLHAPCYHVSLKHTETLGNSLDSIMYLDIKSPLKHVRGSIRK
jgi:hypothetical protein